MSGIVVMSTSSVVSSMKMALHIQFNGGHLPQDLNHVGSRHAEVHVPLLEFVFVGDFLFTDIMGFVTMNKDQHFGRIC